MSKLKLPRVLKIEEVQLLNFGDKVILHSNNFRKQEQGIFIADWWCDVCEDDRLNEFILGDQVFAGIDIIFRGDNGVRGGDHFSDISLCDENWNIIDPQTRNNRNE